MACPDTGFITGERLTTPNDAWPKSRSAALNLRNLIGRGLTRHNGTWALAT